MSKFIKFSTKLLVTILAIGSLSSTVPASAAQSGDLTVTMHYARQAGDFTGRYAWVWYTGTNASGTFGGTGVIPVGSGSAWVPVNNAGIDSYGAVSTFTLTGAANIDRFGVIECSTNSWTNNCGRDLASNTDRFFNVQGLTSEVWLRSGSSATADTTIYTSDSLSPSPSATQTLKIHYNRTDGNYSGWKLYLGSESKVMPSTFWVSPKTYDFDATSPAGYTVGSDQFGAFIETTLPYYAGQTKTLNMIVYSLAADGVTWVKDGGNVDGHRYLSVDTSGTTSAWLVSGDTTGNAAFATDPGNISGTPTPTPTPTDTTTPTAPAITSLSVTSASAGDEVTIFGTDLQVDPNSPTVTVGGFAANVTASSTSAVSFIVPGGLAAGDVSVTVTTDSGTSNSAALTIVDSTNPSGPTIDSFSPESAHAGDVVVINGSGLLDGVVSIDGIETPLEAVSGDTVITFTLPADLATGAYLIRVTTASGSTVAGYTVLPAAPTVSSVTDLQDNPITEVTAGDVVKIVGTNLSTTSSVNFSGVEADLTGVGVIITDTSITVIVPESISGVVTVSTPGGTATSPPLTFLNVAAPVIDLVDPASAIEGDVLTITGSHLLGATVTIGGVSAAVLQATASIVTAIMPYGVTSGETTVVVNTEGGSASGFLTALDSPSPIISEVSPISGAPGDAITVTGKYFIPQTGSSAIVLLGNLQANVLSATTTSITFEVPAGLAPGEYILDIANLAGSVTTAFSVTEGVNPTPTDTPTPTDSPGVDPVVSLVLPQTVQAGDVITILGTNFGNNPVVTVGGQETTVIDCGGFAFNPNGTFDPDFNNCDGHSILILVPEGLPVGSAEILISWDNQKTASTSVGIVADPPSIDGFSDQSGKAGDVVTIYGAHLTEISSVTFDGDGVSGSVTADLTDSNYVANPDGSSVTVTVPAGSSTGTITVTTFSGIATSEDTYEVLPAPTIDSLSSTSGIPGDVITIYGTNLDSVLSVTFNGIEADLTDFNTVVAEDGSSISVVVPEGAATGNVSVTTSGGSAVSADVFSLASAPEILSLSSLMGKEGSVLSISGSNLGGLVSVSFDGDEDSSPVLADLTDPLTKMTDSQVVVVVPVGATSGTITLTAAGGVATSDDVYEIVSPPVVTWMSDTSLKPGSTLTMHGSGFTWAKVRVRGVLATVSASSTDTQLKITVPQLGPGRTTLVITTPGGVVTRQVSISTPAPIIKSFTQSASKKRGVGTVTVIGRNLIGAVVKVGNVTVKLRPGASSTKFTFTLPKRAAVTAKGIFTVTTDGGVVKSKAALKVTAK